MRPYETKPLVDEAGLVAYPDNAEDEQILRDMGHRDMSPEEVARIDPCAPWQLRSDVDATWLARYYP